MFKLRYICVAILLALMVNSCDDNQINNPFLNIDHEALAVTNNDSIVKFLSNHYYDLAIDSIKPLVSGETAMISDSKLATMDVTENDIDYKLYVYVAEQGDSGNDRDKGFPTVVDSVFTKYQGRLFTGSDLSDSFFDENTNGIWFNLLNVVRGWTYGFTKFKGGELKKDANGGPFNGPITYLNGGKGAIFMPSGLAYPSSNQQNWSNTLVDRNLMFYVDLLTLVDDTDHDNDGVPSITEDVDGDGNVNNDDTDGDGVQNFVDTDDDGDGILTKNEDANGNGNLEDDDTDNDGIPNYLDSDS